MQKTQSCDELEKVGVSCRRAPVVPRDHLLERQRQRAAVPTSEHALLDVFSAGDRYELVLRQHLLQMIDGIPREGGPTVLIAMS